MAGTLKSNIQLGDSLTATQNFTLTAAAADGTLKLARGNAGATTQDILTVDAAGIASLLGQRIFSRGNILGTVSQSAGVPTGAVIESGSNANGTYTRFADGTQICTAPFSGAITLTAYSGTINRGVITWTYPAAFVASPVLSAGGQDQGSNGFGGQSTSGLASGALSYFTVSGSVTSSIIGLQAIGRWF